MIQPLKNNLLNKKFNKLENEVTDPIDKFHWIFFHYNSILDVCKHVDDAVWNRIITFLNDLKLSVGINQIVHEVSQLQLN